MNSDSPTQALHEVAAAFPWLLPGNRRNLLKVGSLSLAAALTPQLWGPATARAATLPEPPPAANGKARSVIFLWMGGGVTHIDSFDPKPEAPEEIRGTLATIDTSLPGVQFAETCPELAKIAHKLALVRSFSHDSNDHLMSQAYTLSGRKVPLNQIQTEPNIGSIVSHLHGPRNLLPGYIAAYGWTRPGPPPYNMFVGGWLGEQHAPFCVGREPAILDFAATCGKERDPHPFVEDELRPRSLELLEGLDRPRLGDRAALRTALDAARRRFDQQTHGDSLDGNYDNAFRLLSSQDVRRAFDLSTETDTTRTTYGRTKIGGRCLMARRLVEAGARFVMVDYGYDGLYGNLWDNHNVVEQNFPHICDMAKRPYHVAGIDRAFAALINDLDERGLLDNTLVVFLTEFGRTPKINSLGGRDHWGPAGSIFFSGGGTRVGQVVGATDKQGAFPTTRSYSPADIAATIYEFLHIPTNHLLYDQNQRPHFVLPEGDPIAPII
ncbi:MAG: DUF1501 domain-containing protein [Planctomycetes bacterium]|nr:DUF1501 domain-containing protein [Planctomycetota bacterium]